MSILIPVMRKHKFFGEVTVFYVLCVLSYAMLIGVIFQYFETIKLDYYKPDRILLYLIYTGELLFILLFSPIFVLKRFTAIEEENVKVRIMNVQVNRPLSIQFFLGIIIGVFILLSILHIISLALTYNNTFFSYQRSLMMLLMFIAFSLSIVAYTSFLTVISRNIYVSITITYFTIIGIFGCIFFVVLLLDQFDNPTPIINLSLDICPLIAISSVLDLNLFRLGPFHRIINFEMFEHNYPHWSVHVISYLALSIIFFVGTFLLRNFYMKSIRKQ